MTASIVEEIKGRVKLEELVAESFTLTGKGRVLSTQEHDSLKVRTDWQWWEWYSRGLRGDVVDWYQLVHRCDFRTALEALAQRAGVELRPLSADEQHAVDAGRRRAAVLEAAARYYHQVLMSHPGARAAREWCHGRGWTTETMEREQIGYVLSTDNHSLSDETRGEEVMPLATQLRQAGLLDEPLARAVLSLPAGMVIYVHRDKGRAVYLSGRSVEGKRHYNLPEELAGGKRPYWNAPAGKSGAGVLVVEGQADAISLGQCGIEAMALCGVSGHAVTWVTHVALDNDEKGRQRGLEVAMGINPLLPVVTWPAEWDGQPVKDAADLVRLAGGDVVLAAIDNAEPALVTLARRVKGTRGDNRKALIRQLLTAYDDLDEIVATDMKQTVAAAMGEGVQQFNRLLKAHKKEQKEAEEPEAAPLKATYSMGGHVGGYLFEQCVRFLPEGGADTFYWVRTPEGKVEKRQTLDVGDTTYVPYAPAQEDVITKRVLLFPSDMGQYAGEAALFEETRAFIHRWVDVDQFYEQLATYYVFLTWVYDAFHLVPYLRAIGDTGTGKTRLMKTVGTLCYRPMFLDGATSEAAIFHLIDMAHGTMILDEADFPNSGYGALMSKILNVGNSKHNCILRMQTKADGTYTIVAYEVYGPKCIAGRALFEDRAVESRCLVYRTVGGRNRPDIKRNLNDEFYAQATALRNKFMAYRFRHWQPEIDVPDALSDRSIEPRLDQVSMIIKAIIKDPAMLENLTSFVRDYNQRLIVDRQLTTAAIVVQALANIYFNPEQTLMGPKRDLSVQAIYEEVVKLMGTFDQEEKLSPRKIGAILIELGLPDRDRNHAGRRQVIVPEETLRSLMVRFGIENGAN